jgi:hypothetical protein
VLIIINTNMNIYYCYEKNTGKFLGSGVYQVDDDTYGSTVIPCPVYDNTKELPIWKNGKWEILPK